MEGTQNSSDRVYLSSSIYEARRDNQIIRVSEVIRVAELAYMSVTLVRSQVVREAPQLSVTPDFTLVSVVHFYHFSHVTNKSFVGNRKQVMQFPAYIWKHNYVHRQSQ